MDKNEYQTTYDTEKYLQKVLSSGMYEKYHETNSAYFYKSYIIGCEKEDNKNSRYWYRAMTLEQYLAAKNGNLFWMVDRMYSGIANNCDYVKGYLNSIDGDAVIGEFELVNDNSYELYGKDKEDFTGGVFENKVFGDKYKIETGSVSFGLGAQGNVKEPGVIDFVSKMARGEMYLKIAYLKTLRSRKRSK